MRTKQIGEEPKTFVLVLDTGEELLTSLKRFAKVQIGADGGVPAVSRSLGVAAGAINQRLAAVRPLAYEAADLCALKKKYCLFHSIRDSACRITRASSSPARSRVMDW